MKSNDNNHHGESKALTCALRALGRSDVTVWQLQRKLRQKGFPRAEIQEVIDYLAARGYLDDRRFAGQFIQRCVCAHRKGPWQVMHELMNKGIPKEICNSLIKELYSVEAELEAIALLVAHMKEKSSGVRIQQRLIRRGFRKSSIQSYMLHRKGSRGDPPH